MNVILKRRQLILATLIVALGAAVFVNWYYTGGSSLKDGENDDTEYVQNLGEAKYVNAETQNEESEKGAFFSESKLSRDKANDKALDNLNESLKAVKTGTQEAQEIAASISALNNSIKIQNDLESLIEGKIKGECLVTVNNGKAKVVVSKGALNENTALQILTLVTENSEITAENVSIAENK